MKTLRRLLRRPLRLDRAIEVGEDRGLVFDLELLQRGFQESLLVARLLRRPPRYVKGRK
jgi:hypothetical protein